MLCTEPAETPGNHSAGRRRHGSEGHQENSPATAVSETGNQTAPRRTHSQGETHSLSDEVSGRGARVDGFRSYVNGQPTSANLTSSVEMQRVERNE